MMNGLQAVSSWDHCMLVQILSWILSHQILWTPVYHSPRKSLLGLMSAIYSAGAIVALPFIPAISDGLGRRRAILFGSIIMVIGAILQTAAQNCEYKLCNPSFLWWPILAVAMFVIGRFILGLGIPFAIVAASSLLGGQPIIETSGILMTYVTLFTEVGHPKERAFLGSLFNSCYFIGAIVAAGVTMGTFSMKSNWGWRLPSLLQVLPSAMQIIFLPFIPESPRWLISKGRGDEAFAILAKYHAEGDTESELVKAEYVEIEKTLELERETAKVGWRDLLKTPGMRRRVLIGGFLGLATQWSGNGIIS